MKTTLLKLFLSTAILFNAAFVIAQAGKLDSSFGFFGKDTVSSRQANYAIKSITQKDGKIILAGYGRDFVCVRYKSEGGIDSTYGENGIAQFTYQKFGSLCRDAVIQNDDKMILVGYLDSNGVRDDIIIKRFNTDGKPDSSFGGTGQVITYINNDGCYANAVGLQKDGKIVVGGYSFYSTGSPYSLKVATLLRYTQDGKLDSSFGTFGIIRTTYYAYGSDTYIERLAIQADDKIVAAGYGNNGTTFGTSIARFTKEGLTDTSFGYSGFVQTSFYPTPGDIKIQKDGKIIITGQNYSDKFFTYRLMQNGSADSSFGVASVAETDINSLPSTSSSIAIQPDNKIIIAGASYSSLTDLDYSMVRYLSNGVVDSSFGNNGRVITDFFGSRDWGYSVCLLKDGGIIICGSTYNPRKKADVFSLAKYLNSITTIAVVKNVTVTEGNIGTTTTAKFKIVLSKPLTSDVFVSYTTRDLNATAGSDYTTTSGTLKIKKGKSSANILVPVLGDNTREPNERFALLLSNPVNAIIGTLDSATCTIKNDDPSFAKASNIKDMQNITIIKIYPNPVNGVLRIEGLNANEKTTITIYDMEGKILSSSKILSTSFMKDVKQLHSGNYLVKIESEGKTQTLRFIKV